MLRYLKLLVLLPIGIAIIGFALNNRAPMTLVYWPEQLGGPLSLVLPVFAVLILVLMLGVIIGSSATWLTQGGHRRAERQYRREAERLKSEAQRLRTMQPSPGEMVLPALKSR